MVSLPEKGQVITIEVFGKYEDAKGWVDSLVDGQKFIEREGNVREIYKYDKDVNTLELPVLLGARMWSRSTNILDIVRTQAKDVIDGGDYITERFVMEKEVL